MVAELKIVSSEEKTPQERYIESHPEYRAKSRKQCRDKNPAYLLEYAYNLKARVFAKLGNRCNNPQCGTPGGVTDVRCLQIDHVRNDGHEERYTNSSGNKRILGSRTTFWNRVLKDTEGKYQLLCANCNTIKAWENNQARLMAESRRKGDTP